MMNSISGSASYAGQSIGGPQAATARPVPPGIDDVAKLLGVSTDDLMSSLKSGSSLSDLATQKGVSRDDLLAAIKKGLEADTAASATATGQAGDVDAKAAKIADHKGLPQHHHHHHHSAASTSGGSDLQQNVSDLSSALGISSDELVQALQSGLASLSGASGSGLGSGTGTGTGYGVSASLLQGLQVDQLA
jgi:uncharacterized protein YidB (DUF937 family)